MRGRGADVESAGLETALEQRVQVDTMTRAGRQRQRPPHCASRVVGGGARQWWGTRGGPSCPRLLPLLSLMLLEAVVTSAATICTTYCHCDDEAFIVRCEPSNIDVVPYIFNPSLQQLTMYGTKVRIVDINSFGWYKDLQHANLSNNMIETIQHNTFKEQKVLRELHLAHNSITNLTADMFYGLSNLTVFSLRGNQIEALEGGVFMYLKQLQDLDLSENRISTMEEQALAGLANLRILQLRGNRLGVVPATNLALVPDLAELSLGGNRFTAISDTDFEALRTLKELDLSGAQLGEGLGSGSFRNLTGLRRLRLEGCNLQEVPTAALASLPTLEELHLGHNLFTTLPSNAFKANRNLHTVQVTGCPRLQWLERHLLRHNLHVRQLVIRDNPQLTYMAPEALRFLPVLWLLDLSNNNLQWVSEEAASWEDVEQWRLDGNPLTCNCSVAWLQALLTATNSSHHLRCAAPPRLAGVPLVTTQVEDLACGLDPQIQAVLVGVGVFMVVVLVVAAVMVALYRHHGSCVHRLLKGHHQLGGSGAQCSSLPYTYNYHQTAYMMTPTKPVPVTEL